MRHNRAYASRWQRTSSSAAIISSPPCTPHILRSVHRAQRQGAGVPGTHQNCWRAEVRSVREFGHTAKSTSATLSTDTSILHRWLLGEDVIDWEVDYASSFFSSPRQPGGWQAERRISPDCCISQSVRPRFLASACLDEHHRNNKKTRDVNHVPKCVCLLVVVVFSSPSWQQRLRLISCIIRGFFAF